MDAGHTSFGTRCHNLAGALHLLLLVLATAAVSFAANKPQYDLYRGTEKGAGSLMRIEPKSCTLKGSTGQCMFVWDCIKSDGRHLGTCQDGFLIGSCCGHSDSQNAVFGNVVSSSPKPEHHEQIVTDIANIIVNDSVPAVNPVVTMLQLISGIATNVTTTPPTENNRIKPTYSLLVATSSYNYSTTSATTEEAPTTIPTTTKTATSSSSTFSILSSFVTTTPPPSTTVTNIVSTTVSTEIPTTPLPPVKVPSKIFQECGLPTLMPQMRIVGGEGSRFGAWPWQVSVRRTPFYGFPSTHRCGGAVLSEYWIATAGHCVADLLLPQIRIRVGEYNLTTSREEYPYEERRAKLRVVHPKYNADNYEYDLALVRLDSPLSSAPNIAPICIPQSDQDFVGENATITGWGRIKEGGTLPTVLQEVQVPIMSNSNCEKMFLAAGRKEVIPNFFLCAGFAKGGRDSCQGDSGGPLQLRGKDGRWFLAGIISWGIGCGEPNLPGVCTRISKFKDWILQSIKDNGG